jgi:class 3 adenylate cyclase
VRRITKHDVAEQAGVGLAYVTRLIDAGVLVPAANGTFSEGDVRRARLYGGLERAGLPMNVLVEALERGELSFDFLDLAVYDRFSRLTAKSFQDLSSQEGIPLELLLVVREAMGLAQADPDDQVREDELQVVSLIKLQISKGFDPLVIERWIRVYGDTLRRLTESEADWWRTQILQPRLASGMNPAELLRQQAELGDEVTPLMEQALMAIYHANQEHSWNETLIEQVEDALDRAGLRSKIVMSPSICFLDLTGYTRLTEERGDQAAADIAARLAPLVQRTAERHGGKVVKWLGDGVMFHFRDAHEGVGAALDMREAVPAAGLPPAHIGLHTGPVVFQGGDYFGRTVNLAARIAEQARPGTVLVSQEVVDHAEPGDVAFEPVGSFLLRGVSEPILLHAAERVNPEPRR